MKSNFTAIALISIAAFAGTNSFAGSGNDNHSIQQTAAVQQLVVAGLDASKVSDFDPMINVLINGNYLLPSV